MNLHGVGKPLRTGCARLRIGLIDAGGGVSHLSRGVSVDRLIWPGSGKGFGNSTMRTGDGGSTV